MFLDFKNLCLNFCVFKLEKIRYIKMSATKRLQKELQELRDSGLRSFRNIVVKQF